MTVVWVFRIVVVTLCFAIAAIAAEYLSRRLLRRPFHARRWIWAGAMVASIVLPVAALWISWGHPILSVLFPKGFEIEGLGQLSLQSAEITVEGLKGLSGVTSSFNGVTSIVLKDLSVPIAFSNFLPTVLWSEAVDNVLLSVCLILSVLGGMTYVAMHVWLRKQRSTWIEREIDGTSTLISPTIGPAVVGVRRPIVVLPAWVLGAPTETQRAILQHERAHIAVGDSRLLAVTALLLALMPWNIAMWWQYRRLRAAIETDCDARVLAQGMDVRQYGEMLIGVAMRAVTVPMLSPAFCTNRSLIERRIAEMTSRSSRSRQLLCVLHLGILCTVLATAIDVASMKGLKFFGQIHITIPNSFRFLTNVEPNSNMPWLKDGSLVAKGGENLVAVVDTVNTVNTADVPRAPVLEARPGVIYRMTLKPALSEGMEREANPGSPFVAIEHIQSNTLALMELVR